MIPLVEMAERTKTPDEIALTVLLAVLTQVFLIVVATIPLDLELYRWFSGNEPQSCGCEYLSSGSSIAILISLLVALIPTTIGGLSERDRHRRDGSCGSV
jgi:K+-transporting ATPase ATPase B chain